jgi:hypothetical protein
MGDADSGKERGLSDRITLALATLALLVSAVTLYDQFLKGPEVRAYRPNLVYLTKSQIGIPVAFTNGGTAADVVVNGSLEIAQDGSGPQQTLKLRWVSPFEKRLTYQNGKWTQPEREYSPFTPFPLKAGEADQKIFWFEPQSGDINFQPGIYHACARFMATSSGVIRSGVKVATSASQERCSSSVQFEVTTGSLEILNNGTQDALQLEVKE